MGGAEVSYTVTFLEMRARPERPRPPAPPARGLSLLRAETPPAHFFRYLYDIVGRDYDWTDKLSWTDAQIDAFAQHPDVALYVMYLTGWPAGFVMLDHRDKATCDMAYFGVAAEAMGRGLGDWLLGVGTHMAWDAGPSRLTVNTCSLDHPRALPLYQKWGFRPYAREERRRVVGLRPRRG
jgi:GNAT superfamily N-acetyltransferase